MNNFLKRSREILFLIDELKSLFENSSSWELSEKVASFLFKDCLICSASTNSMSSTFEISLLCDFPSGIVLNKINFSSKTVTQLL